MNTKLLSAAVLALCAVSPARAEHIILDGYCDSLELETSKTDGVVVGTWDYDCTATNTNVLGLRSTAKLQGQQVKTVVAELESYGFDAMLVLKKDHTWSIYIDSGVLVNTGTWSTGTRASGGSRPSVLGN